MSCGTTSDSMAAGTTPDRPVITPTKPRPIQKPASPCTSENSGMPTISSARPGTRTCLRPRRSATEPAGNSTKNSVREATARPIVTWNADRPSSSVPNNDSSVRYSAPTIHSAANSLASTAANARPHGSRRIAPRRPPSWVRGSSLRISFRYMPAAAAQVAAYAHSGLT